MRPSYLLAAALMLATAANSWAQDATDGVPNIKQPDQENIQAQMRDTWETIKQFSADQKDQALAALRHAMDALDDLDDGPGVLRIPSDLVVRTQDRCVVIR